MVRAGSDGRRYVLDLEHRGGALHGLRAEAAASAPDGEGFGSTVPFQLHGDPYPVEDDVRRGCVSMQLGASAFLHRGASEPSCGWSCGAADASPASSEPAPGLRRSSAWRRWNAQDAAVAPRIPRFSEQARPFEKSFGDRAHTSVHVHAASAAEVAASVYMFLTTEVDGSVVKVNAQKLSVKADVFHAVGACPLHTMLKAQVFRASRKPGGEHQLVVNFCRLSGDAVAFGHVFRLASQHIQRRFAALRAPRVIKAEPTPPLPELVASTGSEMRPLTDMLANSSWPAGQSEAAAALTALACWGPAGTSTICSALGELQEVLAGMLAGADRGAAYRAAQLAALLAHDGSTEVLKPLSSAALAGIAADSTDPLMRVELVEVVRAAALGRSADRTPRTCMQHA